MSQYGRFIRAIIKAAEKHQADRRQRRHGQAVHRGLRQHVFKAAVSFRRAGSESGTAVGDRADGERSPLYFCRRSSGNGGCDGRGRKSRVYGSGLEKSLSEYGGVVSKADGAGVVSLRSARMHVKPAELLETAWPVFQ